MEPLCAKELVEKGRNYIFSIARPELVNRTEAPFMWRGGSSLSGISTPNPVAAASATGST